MYISSSKAIEGTRIVSCGSHVTVMWFPQIPLPQSPPWWLLFDADFEEMEAVALELLSLYKRPRVQLEVVEREISKLKEEYQVDSYPHCLKERGRGCDSCSLLVEKAS